MTKPHRCSQPLLCGISVHIFSVRRFVVSPILGYILATLAVVVTAACGLLLFQFAESRPFPLFFLPILFSAWLFGRDPGLLATGLSAAAIQYFFIPPVWSFAIHRPVDLGSQIIFIAEGIIITLFAAAKKGDEEDLERRVAERTVQLEGANQRLQIEIDERKRAESTLEREHQIVQLLRVVAEAANSATSIDEALQSTIDHVCTHLGWPLGHAYRVQAPKPQLVSTGVWYVKDPARFQEFQKSSDALFTPSGLGLISRAIQTKKAIWLEDVVRDPNFLRAEVAKTSGIKTGLAVPVCVSQEVVAVLEFFSTETKESDDRLADAIRHAGIQLGRAFERKDAEVKLRMEERLATIGRTAALLAHEIGNPLAGMAMTIHILKEELSNHEELSGDEILFSVHALSGEINRLASLLQNFRSLAQPQQIELKPTNLCDVAKELLAVERSSYSSHRIQVAVDFPLDLPLIMADQDKLKQVLLNLCRNAIEAMADGGKLTMKAFVSGEHLHLHIIDTGVGILGGIRIFEPFVTTKSEGTGLGLMIVKQIVSAHEGTISYTSERGKGTVFKLTFPLA